MTSANSLSIRLTEPVVFLRGGASDASTSGRRRAAGQPAMLRGLLQLNLAKATKIKNVLIVLEGKTRTEWPEGIGSRRIETSEEETVLSTKTVFFCANATQCKYTRRTASAGPGMPLEASSDGEEADDHPANIQSQDAGASAYPGPSAAMYSHRRLSHDHTAANSFFTTSRTPSEPAPEYTPDISEAHPGMPAHPHAGPSTLRQSRLTPGLIGRPPSYVFPVEEDVGVAAFSDLAAHNSIGASPRDRHRGLSTSSRGSSDHSTPTHANGSNYETRTVTPPLDESHGARGRSQGSRFSFSAMGNAFGRMRSGSRTFGDDHPTDHVKGDDHPLPSPGQHPKGNDRGRGEFAKHPAFEGEAAADRYSHCGWKEFGKGTYTYPISFAVPSNLPPSLRCPFGSVVYTLNAYVHRAGTFASKLTASVEVTLVSCPGEDDTEESECVIIERQWEDQLFYRIALSGKSFPIGGTIPLNLTLMPLGKLAILRISAVLEGETVCPLFIPHKLTNDSTLLIRFLPTEKYDYYAHKGRVARHDSIQSYDLLSIKASSSDQPLLPIMSSSTNALALSPLSPLLDGLDSEEANAQLFNPTGPWVLNTMLKLPDCSRNVQFSNKGNVNVAHTLKITLRVEKAADDTGTKKKFDIIIETPVHILACRCSPEWTSLPTYSLLFSSAPQAGATCACNIHSRDQPSQPERPTPLTSSRPRRPSQNSPVALMGGFLSHADESRHNTPPSAHSEAMPPSPGQIWNTQFARLVAGQESEIGEAPPAYEMRSPMIRAH